MCLFVARVVKVLVLFFDLVSGPYIKAMTYARIPVSVAAAAVVVTLHYKNNVTLDMYIVAQPIVL